MTKWQLFSAMSRGGATITIKGVTGWISAIQLEDGSGSSFNVTIYDERGKLQTVYVRTID